MRLIEEARSTIHITTYILGRGPVGEELVGRLAEKAAGGVKVRLLLDDVGSWRVGRRFLTPLTSAGARVAYFMPVLHIPFRGRANLRNHRKIVVIDGRIALTGGMNLAWPYMAPVPDPDLWIDLSAVVEGPAVADLESLFFSDWAFATGEDLSAASASEDGDEDLAKHDPIQAERPAQAGNGLVQVVASGPDVPDDPLYETLLSQIFAARERIWIVTPYFVPDEMLARALNLAARRGVDVRLIVPVRSNHLSTDLARESYLRELHEAGGRVLLYQSAMLHAKAVVFDDQLAVIGTRQHGQPQPVPQLRGRRLPLQPRARRRRLDLGETAPGRLPARAPQARMGARAGRERGPAALPPALITRVPGGRNGLIQTRPSLPTPAACGWLSCAGRGRCGWARTP